MNPDWTENLHDALEKLQPEEAKLIVESMTEDEICQNVNNREFQQDYIADYIEFLWEISDVAYWRHVKSTFEIEHGVLWSDNMSHFERLCSCPIPSDVLEKILHFAIFCEECNKQDLEAIGCIIKSQVENFNRRNEIEEYILSFDIDIQVVANERINNMLRGDSQYQFC